MSDDRPPVHNQFDGNAHSVVQAGSIRQVTVGYPAATKRLALAVTWDRRVEAAPEVDDIVRSYVETERARLVRQAEAYDWTQNPAASDLLPSMPVHGERRPDRRSRQLYYEQVEDYLNRMTDVVVARRHLLVERHRPSCVELVVENPTDQHYRDIELGLWFPAPARGFDDEFRLGLPSSWPEWPVAPFAPGTERLETHNPRTMAPLGLPAYRTRDADYRRGHDVLDGWSAESDADGTTISFAPFDIRPRRTVRLGPVPLDIPAAAGACVEGVWTATAGDADGACSEALVLEIENSTVDLAELWEPGPPTSRPPSLGVTVAELATLWAARRSLPERRQDG